MSFMRILMKEPGLGELRLRLALLSGFLVADQGPHLDLQRTSLYGLYLP
jgi:hypothetical protein